MTTDYKVTELFCIIDEFCKHFDAGNLPDSLIPRCYPYAIISGDMPIRYSRELPLTEKEQWFGGMALSSTLRAMTEAR